MQDIVAQDVEVLWKGACYTGARPAGRAEIVSGETRKRLVLS